MSDAWYVISTLGSGAELYRDSHRGGPSLFEQPGGAW